MVKLDQRLERFIGRRFFYGWTIVSITFMASMITAGIAGWGLSFFIIPMSEDLGVSRGEFSTITLFRLAALPIIPLLGFLVDKKHGPRVLLTVAGVLGGLTLLLSSLVQSLWQFYLIFGVGFGLATMAMGGQLIGPAVISKWFIRMRGRAMAIGTMGISTGGVVIAPLAGWIVGEYGWRMAWVVLGVLVVLAITPISALFMRRSPEDLGLLPDGVGATASQQGAAETVWTDTEYPWTLRQALRTRGLWVLLGVQILGATALLPIIIHQVAYIQDKGFTPQTATAVATALAFFAIVAKLPWGFFIERVHARWVIALCLVPSGLSLFLLIGAQNIQMLYAYAMLHGLTMGGWATLMNVAWAAYFGRRHMGAIRGAVAPVGNIMGAVSPVLAGWMWDLQGSYDLIFTFFAITWIVAGFLMLLARPPKPPVTVHEEPQATPSV